MRLLRINGEDIELDDRTAIGITKQAYDITKPGVRVTNVSNSFTVPATAANLAKIGNPQDPQSLSTKVYEKMKVNYWIDNDKLIDDGNIKVTNISDRISFFINEKDDIWDELKNVKWLDFVEDFVVWLQENKSYPSADNPFIGGFEDFIQPHTQSTEGLLLPMFFGNLYNYNDEEDDDNGYLEDYKNIWVKYWPGDSPRADGGRFMVYYKTIFEYIEDTYDVNFLTTGSGAVGNVWDDAVALAAYTPIRNITVRYNYTNGGLLNGFSFAFEDSPQFLPLKDQKDKGSKTLYNCVDFFMKNLNVILDDVKVDGEDCIRMARFDDMETLADIEDWSGNLDGVPSFAPVFSNKFAQANYIKFKSIYENGDEELGMRTLTCNNENLDAEADVLEIDGYINSYLSIDGGAAPDLSPTESFKTFSFFISSGYTQEAISIKISEVTETYQEANLQLQIPVLYSLDNEYNLYNKMLTNPKFFKVGKWLTFNDIRNLQFFKQYYIKELGGSFFLSKISGFNPEKSNKSTKIELIKIGVQTPVTPPDLNYWVDGVGDAWVDAEGDYWY